MSEGMQVQRVEPIRNQVARSLRKAISELRFKPGEVLVERELCEWTGASRPSVREALRQVESEGLVTSVAGKGTVVSSVSPDEARQLYEVRGVLEGLAAGLFAMHATPEQRAALKHAVDVFEREMDNPEKLLAIKDEFYRTLFTGSHNKIAAEMTTTLQRRTSFLRATSLSVPGRSKRTLKELREILDAIDRHDSEAAEMLSRNHVRTAAVAAIRRLTDSDIDGAD
jgi:DNA-binding GntR family transcriptional regulator